MLYTDEFYVKPADYRAMSKFLADKPGDWRVISAAPQYGTYTVGQYQPADGSMVTCTMHLNDDALFSMNAEDEAASNGVPFGDGKVIARIPDHLMYTPELRNIGEALQAGDHSYASKILNDSDFRKLRSFRGRI